MSYKRLQVSCSASTAMSAGSTASSVHLLGGRLNLTLVWEAARQELKEILGQPESKKVTNMIICMSCQGH